MRANKGAAFDIVFADPPYGKGLGAKAIEAALAGGWLRDGALVVLEEGREVAALPGISRQDVRRYGDTMVHIGTVG